MKTDKDNPLLIERVFQLELAEGNLAEAEEFATRVLAFNSQQRMARIVLGLRDFRSRHYARRPAQLPGRLLYAGGRIDLFAAHRLGLCGGGRAQSRAQGTRPPRLERELRQFKSFHAGLIADYLGNAIRAEASYRKAYEEAGTSLRVVQAYGNFLERNGRSAEAIKIYRAFIEGGDDNPLILAALDGATKGAKPAQFHPTPGAGAAEAMFSRSPPR